MSWSRFSNSDVYTYPTDQNGVALLACCGCRLSDTSQYFRSVTEFEAHLRAHEAQGQDVDADYIVTQVRSDIAHGYDYMEGIEP